MATPITDFRIRQFFDENDYRGEFKKASPSDLISEELWKNLMRSRDNTVILTTDHRGEVLQELYNLCNTLNFDPSSPKYSSLSLNLRSAMDDLEATIFSMLHGYYRQAVYSLRSAFEQVTFGAFLEFEQVGSRVKKHKGLTRGTTWIFNVEDGKFGESCDILHKNQSSLESYLHNNVSDGLFHQKNQFAFSTDGGWFRRLYSELSDFCHLKFSHTNMSLYNHTIPDYDLEMFDKVVVLYRKVIASIVLLIKIVNSDYETPEISPLFTLTCISSNPVLSCSYTYLF